MASPATTFTSQVRHVPYITNDQFKKAPTGVPWQSLVSGGDARQQEAQLSALIERASTWVDSICQQVLCATEDTEQGLVSINRYGQFLIHPRYQPVTQLTDFWSGTSPLVMQQASDLDSCWVEPKRIVLQTRGAFLGPASASIQLGGTTAPVGCPTFARWSYVNGYPVTTLSASVAAGAMSVEVANPVGIIPNLTPLRIEDSQPEPLTVTAVDGSTVTLSTPLQYAHTASTAVTALPADVEEAVILATSALAKFRGSGATLVASSATLPASVVAKEADPLGGGSDLARAEAILVRGDYMRALS